MTDRGLHHAPRHAERRVFVGISPDHPLAKQLEKDNAEMLAFNEDCRKGGTTAEEIETAEKMGFDTGLRVRHPFEQAGNCLFTSPTLS